MTLCGPVRLRDATVEEVIDATHDVADRRGILPHKISWIHARPGPWVLASVPIAMLDFQGIEESSPARIARALQYSDLPEETMPPGLADYKGRARARGTGKAYVWDGNHRVLAAQLGKRAAVRMWMPREGFLALQEAAVTPRENNPLPVIPVMAESNVTFSTDADGSIVAEVTSDDPLARNTITRALREFWSVDADEYQGANEAKWRRRLRRVT